MGQNDRRFLHAFARIDSSGRIVPGSAQLRKHKPTRGRWIELDTFICCDGFAVIATPGALPYTGIDVSINCNSSSATYVLPGNATTLAEAVIILNNLLGYLGVFSTDGTTITLLLKQSIVDGMCGGSDTITLTVTSD